MTRRQHIKDQGTLEGLPPRRPYSLTVIVSCDLLDEIHNAIPILQAEWDETLGPTAPKASRSGVMRAALARGLQSFREAPLTKFPEGVPDSELFNRTQAEKRSEAVKQIDLWTNYLRTLPLPGKQETDNAK